MVKKKEKKEYIKIKIRYYTVNHKIHKNYKFGGVQQSQEEKKNHFNLGNHKKNTWG